jgi:hypothetical protein
MILHFVCARAQDVVGSTRWRIEIGDGRGEVREIEMKKSVIRQVTIGEKIPNCKPSNESRDPRKWFGDFFFKICSGIKKRSVERREKERQGPRA